MIYKAAVAQSMALRTFNAVPLRRQFHTLEARRPKNKRYLPLFDRFNKINRKLP